MYRATSKVCSQATIPSFGFSGAGFLTAYHLGAAKCLLENGYLNLEPSKNEAPLLTGVSGGALTIAAVAASVNPEVAMETTLAISKRTRQEGGFLDAFKPGFSLLDQVEKPFLKNIEDAVGGDTELLLRRIQGGKLLRIGLTNRSIQPYVKNPKAYCFVDQYRDAEDILAACMLSSFVAGVTGPYNGVSPTMARATTRLREMVDLGFVKKQDRADGEISTVTLATTPSDDEDTNNNFPPFVDGGLSNGFPVIDHRTVLVTPIRGSFEPNRWVCPPPEDANTPTDENLMELSRRVKLYMDRQNAQTLRRMLLSSQDSDLQWRYSQGYDDAKRFLAENNLERVHTRLVQGVDSQQLEKPSSTVVHSQP